MKKYLSIFLTAILLISLVACGGSASNSSSDAKTTSSGDDLIVVGFSQVGAESDWRTANTESMQATFTEENGYKLIFDDAQQKQDNQTTAIRNFIQQEVTI